MMQRGNWIIEWICKGNSPISPFKQKHQTSMSIISNTFLFQPLFWSLSLTRILHPEGEATHATSSRMMATMMWTVEITVRHLCCQWRLSRDWHWPPLSPRPESPVSSLLALQTRHTGDTRVNNTHLWPRLTGQRISDITQYQTFRPQRNIYRENNHWPGARLSVWWTPLNQTLRQY